MSSWRKRSLWDKMVDAPCKCGFLEHQANSSDSPIRFDGDLNEYHFIHSMTTGPGAKMMIYHCPFCGGRAPKSRRNELFHRLSHAESHRLCRLTENLRTLQEVLTALGEPDVRQSTSITTPERNGKPETTQNFPMLIYTKLSDSANVNVMVYPTEKVAITFQGKGITESKG